MAERVRRARVLVVHDGAPAIGRALRRSLAPEHVVVTVSSAREALALLAEGIQFDLILCDAAEGPELEAINTPISVVDEPLDAAAVRALIRAREDAGVD